MNKTKLVRSVGFYAVAAMLCATSVIAVSGQGFPRGPRYATVSATVSPEAIRRGGHGFVTIAVAISPNFHIMSAHPKDPDLIATTFSAGRIDGVRVGAPVYPADKSVTTSSGVIPAYTGNVAIKVPFVVSKSAKAGRLPITGFLTYQGCNVSSCFPPKRDKIAVSIVVR